VSGRDVLDFAFRHGVLILSLVTGVTALTVLISYVLPETYSASGLVLVERFKSPTLRQNFVRYTSDSVEVMQTELELVKSRAVAEAVVDRLKLEDRPEEEPRGIGRVMAWLAERGMIPKVSRREGLIGSIGDGLSVEHEAPANLLRISFTHPNREYAADVARAVTDTYLEFRLSAFTSNASRFLADQVQKAEEELRRLRNAQTRRTAPAQSGILALQIQALERRYLFFSSKLDEARAEEASDVSLTNVRVVDYPSVPSQPRIPRLFKVLAGFAASVLLALSIAVVREYFDHSVRSSADMDPETGVSVLGSLARVGPLSMRRLVRLRS
jgi:uncharacterized protein involved in exopolysaccharide biosynthesis